MATATNPGWYNLIIVEGLNAILVIRNAPHIRQMHIPTVIFVSNCIIQLIKLTYKV